MAQALPGSGSGAASATATFTLGVTGVPAGQTLIANFDGGMNGGVSCAPGACVIQQTSDANGANTFGPGGTPSDNNYLSVIGGQSATFTFADPLSVLSFTLGTADYYNSFLLALTNGTSVSFSGNDIAGVSGGAHPTGLLSFTSDVGISGLTVSSSVNSAELDDLAGTPLPEPATWAMMLMGFGAVGFQMRRSRGKLMPQAA